MEKLTVSDKQVSDKSQTPSVHKPKYDRANDFFDSISNSIQEKCFDGRGGQVSYKRGGYGGAPGGVGFSGT
jgi:hypothetical protein